MMRDYYTGYCLHTLTEQGIAKIKQVECTIVHEHCGFWRMTQPCKM